uniref:Eukaryotic translation initiation factor 5 n=1 Tax=Plectus sambesii TaxID=2011161 RepID=A0A914WNN3_9BILA
MAININRNVADPFYRYKMPRLQAKVEGKGNGIKTVIANMAEIGKALERPPTYPTKYFGCELGAQTNFDLKNERYIVNGEHDASKLQEILDGFIRKFVLCPACDNPETVLSIRNGKIYQACRACGNAGLINQKHKLVTFILKNPPPKPDDMSAVKKENGTPTEENGDSDTHENGGTRGSSDGGDDDEDDDWAPEPVENGDKVVSGQMARLTMNKDLDKSVEERLDMLHAFFLKAKKENTLLTDSKGMLNESERLELKNKAPLLLCDVIFDENVLQQIKEYRTLFLRFTYEDKKAQRHLLGGIEQLISKNTNVLLPKSALIIKTLYDEDIVGEEMLIEWGKKPSSKYVKKDVAKEIIQKAQPVLTWLAEAEEESEDEDDDVPVEFDDRAREVGTVEIEKEAPKDTKKAQILSDGADRSKKQSETKEEADDFNIDDI